MTIFATILAIVHWLLRVWTTLLVVWFRLLAVVRLPAWSRATVDSVRRRLATVDRIPIHVGLVFVEDDISLTDVAKLVVWSMVAGVAYITIYDHRGSCRQKRQLLQQKVVEEQRRLLGKSSVPRRCDVKEHNSSTCIADNDSLLLSEVDTAKDFVGCKSRVCVLGPEDGRAKLADIARQLSAQVAMQRLSLDSLTIPYVDSVVQAKYGFPDPDLVLKFGQVESLLGFLPWQLRVTEILSVLTHRGVGIEHFVEALEKFSHTEQRYGK